MAGRADWIEREAYRKFTSPLASPIGIDRCKGMSQVGRPHRTLKAFSLKTDPETPFSGQMTFSATIPCWSNDSRAKPPLFTQLRLSLLFCTGARASSGGLNSWLTFLHHGSAKQPSRL